MLLNCGTWGAALMGVQGLPGLWGLPAWPGVVGIAWQPGPAVSLPRTRFSCKRFTCCTQGHQVLQQNFLGHLPSHCSSVQFQHTSLWLG